MSKRFTIAVIPFLAVLLLVLPAMAVCTVTLTATSPTTGLLAPATVTFSGTSSCDGVVDTWVSCTMDFGDGTPTVPCANGAFTFTHTYAAGAAPVTYNAFATVVGAPIGPVPSPLVPVTFAATSTPTAVTPSDTIFLGEQGLDITAAAPAPQIAWYASGAAPLTDVPAKVITPDKTNFYVSPADFTGYTGAWYNWGGVPPAGPLAFYVQQVNLDLKIWNVNTQKSINDGSIVRPQQMNIRVDNNLYPVEGERGGKAFLTLKIKDSTGAVLTGVYDNANTQQSMLSGQPDLADNPLTSQWFFAGAPLSTFNAWGTDSKVGTAYRYASGTYEVWVESNLNKMKDNLGSITGQTVSKHYTVTIADDQVTITSNTDTVVRGNDFSVSISGRPGGKYILWIEATKDMTAGTTPVIKSAQAGVENTVGGAYVYEGTGIAPIVSDTASQYARVTLDDSGKRTVGISTDGNTDDKTYTFRAADENDNTKYDTVKVKVVKGAVTIDAEGEKSYYVGQDVKLFGENTDSDNVYLFITGPNLGGDGSKLDDPAKSTITGDVSTFVVRVVNSDDTWDYTWATGNIPLDAGTYTIYAVSQSKSKADISDAEYGTVSVQLRKPFVSASLPSPRIAKGDEILIKGTAEGKPTQGVQVWILGTNKYDVTTASVEDDNTFEKKVAQGATTDWAAGQYFVVVQHPMYNDRLDIDDRVVGTSTEVINLVEGLKVEFYLSGNNRLMGSDAAQALVTVLDKATIDDTYQRLFFLLEEPWISIDAISDKYVGDKFTLGGTTNLAADDTFLVTVISASFKPTEKTQAGEFSGVSGSTKVVKGTGVDNVWSFEVDTVGFKPDQYIVNIECIETGSTATTTFFVSEVPPTVVTTVPPVTSVVTTVPPTATTTTVPVATTTPGFGAVIALIGLGAVAVLVLRRH